MREIAERNPDAFPWRAPAGSAALKVWDRAEWQLRDRPETDPEVAARPILFALRFLARRGELTQMGLDAINSATDDLKSVGKDVKSATSLGPETWKLSEERAEEVRKLQDDAKRKSEAMKAAKAAEAASAPDTAETASAAKAESDEAT